MNPRQPLKRSRRFPNAFTLVELLVVIGLIATLATLLMSAFRGVQESGRATFCLNNLKSIGMAFNMYATENNNLFPAARWSPNREFPALQNPSGRNWQAEVQPYLSQGRTFADSKAVTDPGRVVFCPTYLAEYLKTPSLQKLQASGYGMNNSLASWFVTTADGKPKSVGSWDYRFNRLLIEKPAQTILAGDSDDYWLKIPKNFVPNPSTGFYNTYSDRCGDPVRHNGKANYLFVDGHVARLSGDEAADAFAGN